MHIGQEQMLFCLFVLILLLKIILAKDSAAPDATLNRRTGMLSIAANRGHQILLFIIS